VSLIDVTTQAFYDGAWQDITGYTYNRDPVQIGRGRPPEASGADPGQMTLTLNNRDGRFSPQNPRSPLYGKIGLYTPVRVKVPSQRAGLLLQNPRDGQPIGHPPGQPWERFYAIQSGTVNVTGDIDIRVDMTPESWTTPFADVITSQYLIGGDQRAWLLTLQGPSFLTFRWSPDGTFAALRSASSASLTLAGRKTIRVTLDVNVGGTQHQVRFWQGDSVDTATWTEIGTAQTFAGTTGIHAATAKMVVGAGSSTATTAGNALFGGTNCLRGTVHALQVRNGIDGTVVANPDFEAQEPGNADFTDSATVVWSMPLSARVTNPGVRAAMEVSQWPQRWDVSGRDVHVPVVASGLLRRLGHRPQPVESLMRRYVLADGAMAGYWPCEEPADAAQFASPVTGCGAMQIVGDMSPGSYPDFPGSQPIAEIDDSAYTTGGTVPFHSLGEGYFRGLFHIPSTGLTNGSNLVFMNTVGSTFSRVQVAYSTGGSLTVELRDPDGTLIGSVGPVGFAANGKQFLLNVGLIQDGSDVDVHINMWSVTPGGSAAPTHVGFDGTVNSQTFGRISRVRVGVGGGVDGLSFGHLYVTRTDLDTATTTGDLGNVLDAWSGEPAGVRFRRLAGEAGVQAYVYADSLTTPPMGPQQPGQLIDLLQSCADACAGTFFELRDELAVALQPASGLYNIASTAELTYGEHVSEPFHPDDDDRYFANDVTVTRLRGSSGRAVIETGPLSVQEPPDGRGAGHTLTPTVNLMSDLQAVDFAQWLLNVASNVRPRYPQVRVDLRRLVDLLGEGELRETLLQADIGARLDVDSLPEWLPPEDARLVVAGVAEVISRAGHGVTFATVPHDQYHIAEVGHGHYGVLQSDSATLAEELTTTETDVTINCGAGPDWVHEGTDFDILIGGERMTVTAVGAAASTFPSRLQVLTVVRAVNGVVKAHDGVFNDQVTFFHQAYIGL
jgi:hypothetical protein